MYYRGPRARASRQATSLSRLNTVHGKPNVSISTVHFVTMSQTHSYQLTWAAALFTLLLQATKVSAQIDPAHDPENRESLIHEFP